MTGFWNPGNFCWWNPEFRAVEFVIQLKESGMSLTFGIWNPGFTDKESLVSWCCGRLQSPNDLIQKIQKTLKNTHTTQHKRESTMVSLTPRDTW